MREVKMVISLYNASLMAYNTIITNYEARDMVGPLQETQFC